MSGIIGSTGSKSGVIGPGTFTDSPSFQAAWTDPTSNGVLGTATGSTWNATSIDKWNHGNHFSTSTGAFTAPVNGRYHFTLSVGLNNSGSSFYFLKNGSGIKNTEPSNYAAASGEGWVTVSFSVSMNLIAGDYVGIQLNAGNFASGAYAAHSGGIAGSWGWFEGFLIR